MKMQEVRAEDRMSEITKNPHMYAIIHNQDQPDEHHEVSLVEVTEDRIVAIILALFNLIPDYEWRVEALRALEAEMSGGQPKSETLN